MQQGDGARNQGSLFLTGTVFRPCPFASGNVREPGCSSAACLTPEMLCKLGGFPPLLFSLRTAVLDISCWLLLLGGGTPRKLWVPFGCVGCTAILPSRMGTGGWHLGLNLCRPSTLLVTAQIQYCAREGQTLGVSGETGPSHAQERWVLSA